jgi:hypothetical protein
VVAAACRAGLLTGHGLLLLGGGAGGGEVGLVAGVGVVVVLLLHAGLFVQLDGVDGGGRGRGGEGVLHGRSGGQAVAGDPGGPQVAQVGLVAVRAVQLGLLGEVLGVVDRLGQAGDLAGGRGAHRWCPGAP